MEGLQLYCHGCKRYADDRPKVPDKIEPEAGDERSEDERKRDAREVVEALGWTICDTEQGHRPFTCRHCGGAIAGGTRVTKGLADWYVMGHGIGAWIEWKSAKGRQTNAQEAFQSACDVAGIPYCVCRATAEAVEFLEGLKRDLVRP